MEKKDLSKNNYIGKVIYNEDETYSGRCKIRVFGLFDGLDDELIPWFAPANISEFSSQYGGGNLSVPKLGAYVRVRFPNNDILNGEYTAIQNIDPNLIGKLNPENYQTSAYFYSDTFYPLLAQFGVFGAVLFFLFLKRRWVEGTKQWNDDMYKLFVFIFTYILIQCIAENTFTGANGLPILLMLGFVLSNTKPLKLVL